MSLKMRFMPILLAFSACLFAAPSDAFGVTTVVVVRHAEKVIEAENRDPLLTDAGNERAEALARLLRDVPIEAVYSSSYKRTRLTAAPAAKQAGIEVRIRDPRDSEGLRDEILEEHAGGAVLVVGHSNTVPSVLAALGIEDPPAIADDAYDDCFLVLVPEEGEPALLHLHYGAISADPVPE